MANVNSNVNVTFQTQQAVAQLRQLSAEINAFNRQTFAANSAAAQQQRMLNSALIDGIKTSGQFKTSIVPLISSVDQFSNALEKNRLNLGEYTRYAASQLPGMRRLFTKEFDMISRVAEDRVKKLNTQFINLGESANGMQKALSIAPTALNEFSAQSAIALQRQQIFNKLLKDGSTQLLNWGKNTQWAGRQLMVGFTLPLGLLGAQAAKVFQELEQQAISFKKVYGDIFTTNVEVEQNLAAVKELAAEMTKYGQSAKQTMEIANTAAQSGAKGTALLAATTEATRLAILGQMEQNQAIEATISLQTAFAMSNEELTKSINFLNAVENQTILSLDDVSQAIPRVASVIKGFGGDVQDLSVLLVAMKEGGVSAAEGANALKNSMARVISPTRNALDVSQKYGIALQDIVARNEGKVVPLFQELSKAVEALGGQPRQEVLSAIFGKYQYARIGTLLSNITKEGSQASRALELTATEARDLAASAEQELGVVEQSVATKFTAALEKAKLALAPVGEQFLKALTPVLEVVGRLLTKFDELPGGIKTAIVAATGIIGGIAPIVLMVTGLVANGIANIGKFMLFIRKQIGMLKGSGEEFKFYTSAELEAAAAAASLEGRTSSLTKTMLLQQPAIQSLITLYERLAIAARATTAAMPTTMGAPTPRGGGFAAVAPRLPRAYRNEGGPIFQSEGGKTIVPGSGNKDTVPAMLTPGEFVINKKATANNLPLIEAINNGQVSKYQFGGIAQALRRYSERRTQFAHASASRVLKGKEALALLRPAEKALVTQVPQSVQTSALSRVTLGVSDLENQALRAVVGSGLDPALFSRRIASQKSTPRLFERIPLPKGTKVRFRQILAEEVAKIKKNPMFDDDFAKAFTNAEKRMTKELKNDKKLQKEFVSTISSARQDAFTRIKFSIPEGSPKASTVEEARRIAKAKGLPIEGEPFFYYHSKQRKASALVRMPDGRIVGVQTDSTRAIAKAKGNIIPGSGNKDTVPAMLTPGEFVVNKKSTQQNLPLLHAINDGDVRGYATGDEVTTTTQGRRRRLPGEARVSWQEEVSDPKLTERERRAEQGRAGRAARTGFQVQREHTQAKTSFERGTTRWGTAPENQLSNILKNSEKTRNEYMKRLDKYFEEEKRRVEKSSRTQEQKDRMKMNIDKKRDTMMQKINNNFALNARERQDQAKIVSKMIKEIEQGKLTAGRGGAVSANFAKVAAQAVEAAKSYMLPSRAGLPGAVPLVPPTTVSTPMREPVPRVSPMPAREQSRQERRNQRIEKEAAAKAQKLAERRAQLSEVQRRALEIKQERKITSEEAIKAARAELGVAEKVKQSRMQRVGAGVRRFGAGIGGAVSMASMVPMMGANEEGKFMGMDAGTMSMGMMGAGTLLSVLPMLGPAAGPVAAAAAGIGALALGAKILNDRMIEAAESAAEFGSNVGGTANALNTMAALFGEKTPAQRSTQMQLQFSAPEQEQAFGEFQNYLSSELGTKFLKDFENLTSAERFTKLSDYIRSAIAGGVFDEKKAILFAKTIGLALNDAVLGTSVVADLKKNVQGTGAKGLLGLAEKRRTSVEQRATTDQSEMIGSSIQIIQDYANALALANEELATGTITYEEFTDIATKAKSAQEKYSKSLQEGLLRTSDLTDPLIELGKKTTAHDASAAFNKEMEKILTEEQMNAMKQATEEGLFNIGPAIGGFSANAFEGMMKAQIGSAMAAGVNPDQAIAIAQEIRDNPEGKLGQTYAKLISQGSENALVVAAFEETSDVMAESLGLTEDMNLKFKELGKSFLDAGGNLGEFQNFIGNLPESLRNSMIDSLNNMSQGAQMAVVKGGTSISGAYGARAGEVFSNQAYQTAIKNAEGKRGPKGGLIPASKEDIKNLEDINKTFLNLKENFGEENALQISVAVDSLQNGSKVDVAQWNKDAEKLSNLANKIEELFPPEISSRIKIDYTSPKELDLWSKSAAVFNRNYLTLQNLNPNINLVASMRFLTIGANGEELTAAQVAKNTAELNKAMSILEKSENKKLRKEAYVTIVSSTMLDIKNEATGENFTLKEAEELTNKNMEELAKQTGGKVYKADPSVVQGALDLKLDADQLIEKAKKLEQTAKVMSAIPGLSGVGTGLMYQAAALRKEAEGLDESAKFAVTTAPKETPTSSGGGGGAESPLQTFTKNILDQVKIWTNASAQMSDLNNAKTKFVDMVLKGKGLFDRLKGIKGIDPTMLEDILGMGPKGIKEFLDKYVKGGALTKTGKNLLDAAMAAGIDETKGRAEISTRIVNQQTLAANILRKRGTPTESIQAIAGDTKKSAQIVKLQKEYNKALKSGSTEEIRKAKKALDSFIDGQLVSISAEKRRGEAFKDIGQQMVDANNKEMETGDRYFEKEEKRIDRTYRQRIKAAEDQIDSINKQIDAVNDLIDEQERLNQGDQNRIRSLERQKEMLNRQLEEIDYANELDQRKIDTLQREDELRSRVAESINHELDLMSQAEQEIRDAYEKRIEALDEVARVNDYIIDQQRQQLGLSQAISEGDVYAATAAAQEMRAASAQFAIDQTRRGMETGMETQIGNLRTSEGLTRQQAEEQLRAIQEQSYQTSLKIKAIEDGIYTRTLSMIPIKDNIRTIDKSIRDIQDIIYGRETEILKLQTQRLQPLQLSLKTQQGTLDKLNDQVKAEKDAVTYNGMNGQQWADNKDLLIEQNLSIENGNTLLAETDQRLAGISRKWATIIRQINQANYLARNKANSANAIAAAEISKIAKNKTLTSTEKSQAIKKITNDRLTQLAAIESERSSRVNTLLEKGSNLPAKAAGGFIGYKLGGKVSGDGSRDSVKAMLTPGEFVVRKAMVKKYGRSTLEQINQGSFDRFIGTPRTPIARIPAMPSLPIQSELTQPEFSIPKYEMPTSQPTLPIKNTAPVSSNVNAPVYNTYDVKFNITGTNANTDEIANKVMFKMKQLQRQGIRGNRG